jgi:hypothetical protein
MGKRIRRTRSSRGYRINHASAKHLRQGSRNGSKNAAPRETPRQAELRRRRGELMARPDVQAEVSKMGRIEKYNLGALGQ